MKSSEHYMMCFNTTKKFCQKKGYDFPLPIPNNKHYLSAKKIQKQLYKIFKNDKVDAWNYLNNTSPEIIYKKIKN